MEKPFLGESSGDAKISSDSFRRRNLRATFHRRSDAITHGSRYQKAAALVDLAEDGVGLPEEILDHSDFESAAKLYFVFIQFDFIWTLNYFALIVLNFLEKPLWCATSSAYSCNDRDYFYLGQLPYLTSSVSLIYEGVTLIVLALHIFFPILYEGFSVYWKNTVNRLKTPFYFGVGVFCFSIIYIFISYLISVVNQVKAALNVEEARGMALVHLNCIFLLFYVVCVVPFTLLVVCLLILVADLVVYSLYLSPVAFSSLPFRAAPYIRVIFFILSSRDLQKSFLIVVGMLGTYLNVLALLLLFLLFASWLAYVMFEDTNQGKTVFTSYGTTLYQLFVLFTTSNNPDVWIPAYKDSRWYCLFFVVYVLLGVYFVTNLILAVVYDSFKSQLVKQVSAMDQMRKRILIKAFNLIDKYNAGFLNKEQCILLFEELNKYRTLPKISREEFELIFDQLDDTRDFKINLDEFSDLCNAIALRFQKEDVPSCFEKFPSIYHSPFSEKLKGFVRSLKFGYAISLILVVNLVAVVIETTLDIEDSSSQKAWQSVEFVFGWIYVLEMALKVYSYGFLNYWRDGQNCFDFLITWVIVVGETITFASPDGLAFLSNGEWIRYLLLARMLRLIRLLMYVQSYRAFVATFLTLIPSLMPYLGMIFCILCVYCSLGVQIFGGIVNVGNSNLEATDMYDADYVLFNFNDYPNGMVTLFNLLVMGNWQIWMQSYKELTGSSWTLAYFISFYLISVLLLLNLVVAFVLEAFFTEMELEISEEYEKEDKDPRNEMDRHRSIGTKTRSQRVDILLHHMLKAELDETQATNA